MQSDHVNFDLLTPSSVVVGEGGGGLQAKYFYHVVAFQDLL